MDLLLAAALFAFIAAVTFVALLRALAGWQAQVRSARNDAAPACTPPPAPSRRPHNPAVPMTLGQTLPADTIRAMYRAAGLADPSCHCSAIDRPHLVEDHP